MNVLKSLVDWERSHRESEKQTEGIRSSEEKVSAKETLEIKIREDITSAFEKAKAHKSTMEAAVSEVTDHVFDNNLGCRVEAFSNRTLAYKL